MSLSVAGRTAYFVGDFDGHTFTSPDAATYTPPAGTVLQGFESTSHGDWTTTGTAFGSGPVVPGADVTGVQGSRIVDSFGSSDADTGTLTSPAFTVDQKYLDFLIAGGNHPHVPDGQTAAPAGTVFADFEGATFGDGWAASGDFAGATPTTSNLAGQLGSKVLDTCIGACDPATGTIWSPDFTIDSAYINFLVAGGNHAWGGDAPTAVNLRTATGNNGVWLDWVSWSLADLQGKQAQVQLVDSATGDWGHLLADHFMLAAKPALGVMKRARFLDHGNDFYAAVSYNDAPDGKRIVFGWMGNWDYQNATPTNTWRGEQSLPRELSLKMVNGRETVTSAPVPQLNKLLGKSSVRLRPGKGSVAVTSGVKKVDVFGTALRVQVTIDPGSSSSTGVDVRVSGGERTRVGYDAASREVFIDRTKSGASDFDPRFAARHSAPLEVGSSPVTLDVWVDSSSVEVFAQGGQVALTDLIYPSLGSTGVQLFAEGGTSQVKSLVVTPVKAAS
ncbi:GH32 C-terminal domain-containing protein [Luteococcus sanguinis]|uniref:GH32 C-terminal domain-containing protein n=1 Tax=Luteococcus sanguinis TaxID=174038 RepID=A0ABW1X370_9ACTN